MPVHPGRWAPEDQARKARAWNLGMLRAYARKRAAFPSHHVMTLRDAARLSGLKLLAFEFELGPRPYWFDILACRSDGLLLVLDGSYDGSHRRGLTPLVREILQGKQTWTAEVGLPYLEIWRERGVLDIQMRLLTWLRDLSTQVPVARPLSHPEAGVGPQASTPSAPRQRRKVRRD